LSHCSSRRDSPKLSHISRRELVSEKGIIDAPELYRLVLERAKTAREAIRVADELTKAYGYNDWGECFLR
jgi:dipeptidase